jgi:hypothetical protein
MENAFVGQGKVLADLLISRTFIAGDGCLPSFLTSWCNSDVRSGLLFPAAGFVVFCNLHSHIKMKLWRWDCSAVPVGQMCFDMGSILMWSIVICIVSSPHHNATLMFSLFWFRGLSHTALCSEDAVDSAWRWLGTPGQDSCRRREGHDQRAAYLPAVRQSRGSWDAAGKDQVIIKWFSC